MAARTGRSTSAAPGGTSGRRNRGRQVRRRRDQVGPAWRQRAERVHGAVRGPVPRPGHRIRLRRSRGGGRGGRARAEHHEARAQRVCKLSPVYQGFDPWSREAWRLYEIADALGIPIMFHQAGAFAAQAALEYGNPCCWTRSPGASRGCGSSSPTSASRGSRRRCSYCASTRRCSPTCRRGTIVAGSSTRGCSTRSTTR